MLIKFIDKNGNLSMTDDTIESRRMDRIEKIGNTYFEKREVEPAKKVKVEVIKETIVEPIVEPIEEEIEQVEEIDEAKLKDFLKEKKVRGFGLLKGESLLKKAKDLGFNS